MKKKIKELKENNDLMPVIVAVIGVLFGIISYIVLMIKMFIK